MNHLFIYIELQRNAKVAEVSLELLTKGRSLADELGCLLEGVVIGEGLEDITKQVLLMVLRPPRPTPGRTLFRYICCCILFGQRADIAFIHLYLFRF